MATQQLATSTVSSAVEAAKSLHPRLLHLFTRWPQRQIVIPTETPTEDGAEVETTPKVLSMSQAPYTPTKQNPFMPWRNAATGRWHQAHYGLRRQAEMFKLAKKYGVMELMPLSPKHPEIKARKRAEQGVRVKGTGVGQKVKGHKWERTLDKRLDERRKAMADMPALIKQWQLTGHGRGWKKYPGK